MCCRNIHLYIEMHVWSKSILKTESWTEDDRMEEPSLLSYRTEDLYKWSQYIFKIIFLIYFDIFSKESSALKCWRDYFLGIFQNNLNRLMTLSLDAPRDPVFLSSPFLQCRSQTHPRVGPRPSSKQRVGKHSFLLCLRHGRNSASTHSDTHTYTYMCKHCTRHGLGSLHTDKHCLLITRLQTSHGLWVWSSDGEKEEKTKQNLLQAKRWFTCSYGCVFISGLKLQCVSASVYTSTPLHLILTDKIRN